jgi:acyl carrier protein
MSQKISNETRDSVRTYLLEEFLPGTAADDLEDDTPLLSGGILDSISTIKLVSYLEEKYAIQFEAHEMSADYLDTVSDIVSLVDSKRSANG